MPKGAKLSSIVDLSLNGSQPEEMVSTAMLSVEATPMMHREHIY